MTFLIITWFAALAVMIGAAAVGIVAVFRRGYWIRTGSEVFGDYEFVCSVCGETYWEGRTFPEHAHYCQNCGARMKGESTDGR